MGSSTYIRFFTLESCSPEIAVKILQSLGTRSDIIDVTRYSEESDSWASRNDEEWDYPDCDFNLKRMPLVDLPQQFLPEHPLLVHWFADSESLTSQFRSEIRDNLESVRGDHYPGNTGMEIGAHDVFETLENSNGTYFGRANFSVYFYGYRIPSDLQLYRESVTGLFYFNRIQALLADIFPATWKHAIYAE
jgi:hypothetical protein